MSHYHPLSYETEARIRQREKLAHARRRRELKTVRAGQPHARPGPTVLARMATRLYRALVSLKTEKAPAVWPGPSIKKLN